MNYFKMERKQLRDYCCCIAWIGLLLCWSPAASAEFSVTPRLTTGIDYTDNLFLEPDGEPDGDQSGSITTVSPGVDFALSGRKAALEISFSPTYSAFNPFPEYNLWSHDAGLHGWAEIADGTRIEVDNTYSKSNDPVSETDATVRRGRSSHVTNTAGVAVVNQFGIEDTFELRYEHRLLENEDLSIEDSAYHKPSALVTWWFSPARYAVEMEGSNTVSDFDRSENFETLDARMRLTRRFGRHVDSYVEYSHSATDFLADGTDYQVYNPMAGFIWSMAADTEFSFGFGYFYRDMEDGDTDEGIAGSVDMRHDWTDRGSLSFKGDMGYDRAYFGAENLGFNPYSEVSGTITQQLSRRVTGEVSAGFRDTIYVDQEPDREDTLIRAGGSLTFQALPWLAFQMNYEYRRLDSSTDLNDYVENRGSITVSLTPRKPIRF